MGRECQNPYAGTGNNNPEEVSRITREGDAKAIRSMGFHVNGFVMFSEIFRRIANSNYLFFGYDDLASFVADLDKVFHPKLAALYRR